MRQHASVTALFTQSDQYATGMAAVGVAASDCNAADGRQAAVKATQSAPAVAYAPYEAGGAVTRYSYCSPGADLLPSDKGLHPQLPNFYLVLVRHAPDKCTVVTNHLQSLQHTPSMILQQRMKFSCS